jgi:prefoldin alpha subunit
MADEEISQQDVQEAMAQLQYLQNVYTQQYDMLNEQIATYNLAREAVARSIEIIDNAKSLENSHVLLNTEGGTYIGATVSKIDKMMTYVGAGYLVEKTVAEAKEFLETAMKNSETSASRLIGERQKVEKELFDISYRMAALRQG